MARTQPPLSALSPDNRKLLLAGFAILVAVFALVFSNVGANHAPKPHQLPVGIVGSPQVVGSVASGLEHSMPGAYDIHGYSSPAAANTAILHRKVYGAYQPPAGLTVATAASPPVATLLQRTFTSVAGRPIAVQDLAPLPPSDSSGATTFSALLSLIIAGLAGTSIIFMVTQHRTETVRVVATIGLGIAAGFLVALITNVIVAAFPGHFFAVWYVAALFVLAIGLPIAAFQLLFGFAGTAIGFILFLVIGNPASGGSSAPELLPGFWRALSPRLPTGAAVSAMRDVVYFNGHGTLGPLLVLGVYSVAGAVVAMVVYGLRLRSKPAS